MSKYIIKNCPAYNEKGCLYSAAIFPDESMQNRYITFAVPCQDCTDCLLKQIAEYCKNIKKDHYWGMREIKFSQEILKLLDIQEVE